MTLYTFLTFVFFAKKNANRMLNNRSKEFANFKT